MMKTTHKLRLLFVFLLLTFIIPTQDVAAETCSTEWVPNPPPGHFKMVCEGGDDDPDDPPEDCIPGIISETWFFLPSPTAGRCEIWIRRWDECTGIVVDEHVRVMLSDCPGEEIGESSPCTDFQFTGGGLSCSSQWYVEAQVSFPAGLLDVRPFPATLVRWPTAARCSGLLPASGSGTYDYVSYGGGSPSSPQVGDWQNLRLTLTLRPAGPLFLTLPHIGDLVLPPTSNTAQPLIFQWEVPSHPEVGGSVLAGSVSGLGELPADMPLFTGSALSPYRLFWRLTYQEYERYRECEPGPRSNGEFQCKTDRILLEDDGHWEYYYEWENRSMGGEIHPSQVAGLPPELAADLNGDGTPDAYWNSNVTIRRMDEANRVDNPLWAASWNWGGAIYWGVREGQGQIGWPGNP
jgi:hypothetical protein